MIVSYHAMLSAEAVALEVLVFVCVQLPTYSSDNVRHFLAWLRLEDVQEAYSLTDESDYLVNLSVPTLKELSRLLSNIFFSHPSVAYLRSSIVVDRLKKTGRLPNEAGPRQDLQAGKRGSSEYL